MKKHKEKQEDCVKEEVPVADSQRAAELDSTDPHEGQAGHYDEQGRWIPDVG